MTAMLEINTEKGPLDCGEWQACHRNFLKEVTLEMSSTG